MWDPALNDRNSTWAETAPGESELTQQLAQALDALTPCVAIMAATGEVVHANRQARQQFAQGGVLRVCAGHLALTDPGARPLWAQARLQAMRSGRALLSLAGLQGEPVCVACVRLPNGSLMVSWASAVTPLAAGSLAWYAQAHGLSPCEAQVLVHAAKGWGAPGIAGELGVAVSTVRTHMQHIRQKTGAASWHALLSQLAQVAQLPSAAWVQAAPT